MRHNGLGVNLYFFETDIKKSDCRNPQSESGLTIDYSGSPAFLKNEMINEI